jgi:hypothetical protein
MNVGKAFEWLVIGVIALIGGRYLLNLLESATGSNAPAPQTQDPPAANFIGWPYGTGVVYVGPGIVGSQLGAPGTASNPWVGPGSPSQGNGYAPWTGPGNPGSNRGFGNGRGPIRRPVLLGA